MLECRPVSRPGHRARPARHQLVGIIEYLSYLYPCGKSGLLLVAECHMIYPVMPMFR